MTQEEKRTALGKFFAANGILHPDKVEEAINKYAAMCTDNIAAQYNCVTNVDKAYQMYLIEIQANSQSNAPAPTSTNDVTVQPTEGISAAEKKQISKALANQKEERVAVSNSSSIDAYVFDRPSPKDHIKPGTKGTINKDSWKKIEEKYSDKVLPDDENLKSTTNYKMLKAAAEAGTPVDVYIGELNTKPLGYIVKKGSATGTQQDAVQMTKAGLHDYLVLETAGYILSSDTKPGARVKYAGSRPSSSKPGQIIAAKTMVADANKKKAVEAGSYVISREVSSEVEPTVCKAAAAFKIDTGTKKENGDGNLIKTIRVSVKADLPKLVRKPEFVDVFGTGDKVSNANLETAPEGKMATNVNQAQQFAIASLRQKLQDPIAFASVQEYADKLSAFGVTDGAVPQNVTL